MIEPVMYAGLGFFAASLFLLAIMPIVHARAVRLTARRLGASIPLSIAEVLASRDHLRAEFAMSARRLETSVERFSIQAASARAELGRKTAAVNRLKIELGEKTAALTAFEARETAPGEANASRKLEGKLAEMGAELARVTAELKERSVVADSQRIEIVALKLRLEAALDRRFTTRAAA